MAEMQHRSKHNAEDEIASPRKRVNGNAEPHSRIVRNAKLCVLILLFIILPSCKHGSCKECRSLTGQNDRYKYINTKCNYFHQKFCKFRKSFYSPAAGNMPGCLIARMKCAESGIFKIKNRKCHPVQGGQGSFG